MNNNNEKSILGFIGSIIFVIVFFIVLTIIFIERHMTSMLTFLAPLFGVVFAIMVGSFVMSARNMANSNKQQSKPKQSEWDRLGIKPNDFSVDQSKYSSNKKKSQSKGNPDKPKPTVVVDYEKEYKELEIDGNQILTKVLSESIDEEGKNWKESFKRRLNSSYDPSKE